MQCNIGTCYSNIFSGGIIKLFRNASMNEHQTEAQDHVHDIK